MKTFDEWCAEYRLLTATSQYWRFYTRVSMAAIAVGEAYMRGAVTIDEVANFLCTTGSHWPFGGFLETAKLVKKGADRVIVSGSAKVSRVQPAQDQETLLACKRSRQ